MATESRKIRWTSLLSRSFPTYTLKAASIAAPIEENKYLFVLESVPGREESLASFLKWVRFSELEDEQFKNLTCSSNYLWRMIFVSSAIMYKVTQLNEAGKTAIFEIDGVAFQSSALSPVCWDNHELYEPILINHTNI